MKIHSDIQQGTPEWHKLRTGRITGTRIAKMAGGKPATVDNLCYEVAAERLTGQSSDNGYVSEVMARGVELEAEARSAFSVEYLLPVTEVGFVEVDDLFGVSPDGLIGDDSGLELKCPLPHTHLKYLMAGETAWRAYRWQVQGGLWATGRSYWYFVSYCPAFEQPLHVNIVETDEDDQKKISESAAKCREKITEIVNKVKGGE